MTLITAQKPLLSLFSFLDDTGIFWKQHIYDTIIVMIFLGFRLAVKSHQEPVVPLDNC